MFVCFCTRIKFSLNPQNVDPCVLIPHELLRWEGRYERDAKCSNDIRAGGTTNKEAPLWAPSGKNLTTPENYIELARLVQPDLVQVI